MEIRAESNIHQILGLHIKSVTEGSEIAVKRKDGWFGATTRPRFSLGLEQLP